MKKILISLSIIGVVGAAVIGFTIAYFNDTETSTGNIFVAGTMDLKVDHKYAMYNGNDCYCRETGNELIANGGFETSDVPTGGWAIYPNGSLTFWNVDSGPGLEIQDHAAGNPHGGNQLAELDSWNSSTISQTITTVAGKQYRLTFWYSPRPNIPAGDNAIGVNVKVTSGTITVIDDTVGASSAGDSQTNWQQITYNFIATDTNTKITFSDRGTYSNSYGGYLDDISVKEFVCDYPAGGTCNLWSLKDLEEGDFFWNFGDVKPGDYGVNVISLHAYSNDAYACLAPRDIVNKEETVNDPEIAAGDNIASVIGELSNYITMFYWEDDGDGIYEGEPIISGPNNPFPTVTTTISLTASHTKYIGLAWCVGKQTLVGNNIVCDGSTVSNIAQTDTVVASFGAYAEQQRNNTSFRCFGVQP